jgi:hypothetical protein
MTCSAPRTTAFPSPSRALPASAPGPHCVLDDVVVYRELVEEDGLAAIEVDWGSLLPRFTNRTCSDCACGVLTIAKMSPQLACD